jgi:pimeloyl-ACP methyl ester carboxylesterase
MEQMLEGCRITVLSLFKGMLASFLISALVLADEDSNHAGLWYGDIVVPSGKLAAMLKIKAVENGTQVKLSVPAQGLVDLLADSAVIEGRKITVEWKGLSARYYGKLNEKNDLISGKWNQGGAQFDLDLRTGAENAIPNQSRPQEPIQPVPYKSIDLVFPAAVQGAILAGTLTTPVGKGPFPTIVLVTGSGPQNRDQEILGHKPFLVIADYFTRRGFAVFRYDDRGVASSTGDFSAATTEDFARDLASVRNALAQRNDIDPQKIAYVGHSEGGMVAPMAHVRFQAADALILIAPPAVPLGDVLIHQQRLIMTIDGVDSNAIKQQSRLQKRLNDAMIDSASIEKAREKVVRILKSAGVSEDQVKNQADLFVTPWFKYALEYNPQDDLIQIDVPVFAIFGEKDMQVSPEQNIALMSKFLSQAPSKNTEIKVFSGLNHLMQPAETGSPSEYALIETTISESVLADIHQFLRDTAGF